MYFLVAGFQYNNAPIEHKEKLSFKIQDLKMGLQFLVNYPAIKEAVILIKQDTTEIYTVVEDVEIASGSIAKFMCDYVNISLCDLRKYMYTLIHDDTVKLIFKVTSGIESLEFGEDEITKDVQKAINIAKEVNASGKLLEYLFNTAVEVSNRIRNEVFNNYPSLKYADTDYILKSQIISEADKILKEEILKFDKEKTILDKRFEFVYIKEKLNEGLYSDPQEKCRAIRQISKIMADIIITDPTVRIMVNQKHEDLFQGANLLQELFDIETN